MALSRSKEIQRAILATVCCLITIFSSVVAQATTETEVTTQTLYVNPQHEMASDENEGTSEHPFATIQAAVNAAIEARIAGEGTTISLAPATYRESVNVSDTTQRSAPIVIEAQQTGTAIISGSEIYTDWQPVGNGIYSHLWDKDWGLAGNPWGDDREQTRMEPIVKRREMVFVDGILMTQVVSVESLAPGHFYVDEDQDQILLYPYPETNLDNSVVEVTERQTGLNISKMRNLVLRGIVVQHVASGPNQAGAYILETENLVIEDSEFTYNNWVGLEMDYVKNATIRRSHADRNGERGMGARNTAYFTMTDSSFNANNWRGGWGEWYGWDAAGFKCVQCVHTQLYNITATDNLAMGIWFDYVNKHIVIDQVYVVNNYEGGLFIEASFGPVTVRNSQFLNNRSDSNWSSGGIFITGSNNVLLTNNILVGNEQNQLRVNDPERRVVVTDIKSEHIRLMNNLFVSTSPDQLILQLPWHTSDMVQTMTSVNNQFYQAEGGDFIGYNWSDEVEDFETWGGHVDDIRSMYSNELPSLDLLNPILDIAAPSAMPATRATEGLQALYTFTEGEGEVVSPSEGTNAPELIINNQSAVQWLPGGGLMIEEPVLIASEDPASELVNAITETGEITVEAWLRSAQRDQYGPARIVTLSDTTSTRNFTLSQGEAEGGPGSLYNVRLRTTTTDTNGMPAVLSDSNILRPILTHVVYTRSADGTASLYLDGVLRELETVEGDFSNWDENYRLALANELTGDRPWLGTLYMTAIYDRALTQAEVEANFSAGLATYLSD